MNQYQLIVLFEVLAHASMLNYASPVQLCGRELTETLRSICGDRGYYSPGQSKNTFKGRLVPGLYHKDRYWLYITSDFIGYNDFIQ